MIQGLQQMQEGDSKEGAVFGKRLQWVHGSPMKIVMREVLFDLVVNRRLASASLER